MASLLALERLDQKHIQIIIVRQNVLRTAQHMLHDQRRESVYTDDEVRKLAERFEEWVWRETA